jgi:hypothetical protein
MHIFRFVDEETIEFADNCISYYFYILLTRQKFPA